MTLLQLIICDSMSLPKSIVSSHEASCCTFFQLLQLQLSAAAWLGHSKPSRIPWILLYDFWLQLTVPFCSLSTHQILLNTSFKSCCLWRLPWVTQGTSPSVSIKYLCKWGSANWLSSICAPWKGLHQASSDFVNPTCSFLSADAGWWHEHKDDLEKYVVSDC